MSKALPSLQLPALPPYVWWIAGGLAALWVLGKTGTAGKLLEGLAKGAVGAAGGAATGAVVGIGEAFGIPETSYDQCTIDLANGDLLKASFSCPAPRWARVAVLGQKDFDAEKLKFIRANS